MPITQFVLNAVTTLQGWFAGFAVLALFYGAYLLWTSGDNPQSRSRAWGHLFSVAAGLVVVIFAKDIVQVIFQWAGLSAPL